MQKMRFRTFSSGLMIEVSQVANMLPISDKNGCLVVCLEDCTERSESNLG